MSRIIAAAFVAMLTTGCLTDMMFVEMANERFIQLDNVTTFTQGEALEMANEHCKKYGRYARPAPKEKAFERRYDCVE